MLTIKPADGTNPAESEVIRYLLWVNRLSGMKFSFYMAYIIQS
jgi:hypothetical protein